MAPDVGSHGAGRTGWPKQPVRIPAGPAVLDGDLTLPQGARAIVLFAHGSGSSRHSPRNQAVAAALAQRDMGTLLMDLLTPAEEAVDERTRQLRFDIPLLAGRLVAAVDWLRRQPATGALPIGLFGASTGAAAALIAAARRPDEIGAVVSRGGRPDLAGDALPRVRAPTLLIVGEWDEPVIELNQQAKDRLTARTVLMIVPRATHLFEEPGALEDVSRLAGDWFGAELTARGRTDAPTQERSSDAVRSGKGV